MTECESLALRIVADDLPRNRSVGRIGVSEVRKGGSWIAIDLFVRFYDLRRDPIGMGTQRSANQTSLPAIGYGMLVGKGRGRCPQHLALVLRLRPEAVQPMTDEVAAGVIRC